MTARYDDDRLLSAWLHDTAPAREPEHLLGEVLARTARTRRRGAWRIPERWLPMSAITSRLAPASPVPWRPILIAAVLLVALAIGLVLVAGAAKPMAPPFGLASNGQLLFSVDGDIVVADSPTGTTRVLIGGSTTDAYPLVSPDGSRIAFIRGPETAPELWVAKADGQGAAKIAGPWTQLPQWAEWSPSGDVLALSGLGGDDGVITLARADGAGSTRIETGLRTADFPRFRPVTDAVISFRGEAANGDRGFYLVNRDGSGLKPLDLDAGFRQDEFYSTNQQYFFQGGSWAASGAQFAYFTLEPHPGTDPGFRLHLAEVDAAGVVSGDRVLAMNLAADDEWDPILIPGGDRIVYEEIEAGVHRLMIGSTAAGAAAATQIGDTAIDDIGAVLSPDGRQLIAIMPRPGTIPPVLVVLDLASGDKTSVSLTGDVVWQRRAP